VESRDSISEFEEPCFGYVAAEFVDGTGDVITGVERDVGFCEVVPI